MREFIKKHWYDLLICSAFTVTAVIGIAAMVQSLRPINGLIENKKRLIDVFADGTAKLRMEEDISSLGNIRSMFIWLYLAVIGFFMFMAAARFFVVLNKRINKFIMPLVGFINTIVLFCVASGAGAAFDNLGIIPGIQNISGSGQIPYFLPAFFIFIIPLLFAGILPLISGIKNLFPKSKKTVCLVRN